MKLLVALISVLLFVSTSHSVTIYESSQPGDFDFYLFVQQWIYSYCDSQTCIQNKEREAFTIHGLWPNDNDGSYPSFCSGPSFNANVISDLEDQLNYDWPSLTGPNTDFWTHEYSKHGTCSITGPITDEHDYFAAGIKLYSQFNITAALEAENIVPSQRNTYKPSDITNAIASHFGGTPGIQCTSGQLQTVAVCINKETLEIMDCPTLSGWGCSGAVKFPSSA